MYELETESEEDLFNMSRPQEDRYSEILHEDHPSNETRCPSMKTTLHDPTDTNLIRKKEEAASKISGKAWGRCGKFICCREDYPKSVFFIVGNEFCERFSYYGMRAVLVIYLTQWLHFSKDTATAVYHAFAMLCYFSPLIGAMIADGWLGRYKTILWVSMIYGVGNAAMALTALPPPEWYGPAVALLLIGLGTGGIKPCVSAFGGDQFKAGQDRLLSQFFSVFYFAINAGSFLSTILTPIFRANFSCFGTKCPQSCYPLAFGVPAMLMFVAIALFIIGSKTYTKTPASGNVIGRVFMCIGRALKNRCCPGAELDKEDKTHWLDYANDKYSADFIADIKQLLHVVVLYIPLPIFWALFDQQGSRWTLQATKMDGRLPLGGVMLPDQVQVMNPILILVFIPLFENVIYPLLDKCKIPNRPLQRMVAGMSLASVSFIIAALLQIKIDNVAFQLPPSGYTDIRFINAASCNISITSDIENLKNLYLPQAQHTSLIRIKSGSYLASVNVSENCYLSKKTVTFDLKDLADKTEYIVTIGTDRQQLIPIIYNYTTTVKGSTKSYVNIINANAQSESEFVVLQQYEGCSRYNYSVPKFSGSASQHLAKDTYDVTFPRPVVNGSTGELVQLGNKSFTILGGAAYTIVIMYKGKSKELEPVLYEDTLSKNGLSMFAQIPQYVVITAGEIMFSITGLSFSYSQAPASMKSVVQAFWLLTVAFGNLIVVIVAEARFIKSQTIEFFFFAGLMALVTIIFALMAVRYKYIDTSSPVDSPTDTSDLVDNAEPMATSTELKDASDLT